MLASIKIYITTNIYVGSLDVVAKFTLIALLFSSKQYPTSRVIQHSSDCSILACLCEHLIIS
jgi:hypothetical protein